MFPSYYLYKEMYTFILQFFVIHKTVEQLQWGGVMPI